MAAFGKHTIWALCMVFAAIVAHAQPASLDSMQARNFKLSTFDADAPSSATDAELMAAVPATFHAHPEFGKLPYNCGLDSVFELIQDRTEYTRTLVKKNTNGKVVYIQKGYSPLHYLDNNGWWRTLDERLHTTSQSGLFEAVNQYSPTRIDANSEFAAVQNGNSAVKFNKNLLLFHEDADGNRTLIATADWSNYTAGSEGMKVTDIWPGIDMEMIVSGGKIKTNYYIKTPVAYANGWLVIEDHPELPSGSSAAFTSNVVDQDGLNYNDIDVRDANGNTTYNLSRAFGFDQSHDVSQTIEFGCKLGVGNQWQIYIPVSWAGNNALQFPLVIDPLVSSSATTNQASIGGSYQEPGGTFTSSCNYNMNVPTPANCTITDVLWSFNYIAQNGAALCQGAVTFTRGACNSPSTAGFYWFCNNCVFAGTCTGTNISLYSDISGCLPAPACASSNLSFTMKFYARGVPAGACSNFYIGANSNWVMTIQGQTVAQPAAPTSSNGTTICLGTGTTLTATGNYGVAPYTYLWSPGGQTTQSATFYPTSTTTYTCTITDACGQTAQNTVTINVTTANTLTPAPAFSISLNPASGTPCPVTATVTYTGTNNYGGGAENYQWSFGGASSVSPSSTSGSSNAPPYGGPYTVVYNTAGSYALSVSITKSGQCASATQNITICGALPIELISFDGEYNGHGQVILNWTTATETENNFFTVERTTDGFTYEEVGRINTKAVNGNSVSLLNYTLVDENPFMHGTAYYRLRQTDINGNSEVSRIMPVTVTEENFGFFVHPNPAQDNATLNFYAHGVYPATIRIIDYTGKVIFETQTFSVEGDNSILLDMSQYANGIYLVQAEVDGTNYSTKLIK
jgi:hypothetical protein